MGTEVHVVVVDGDPGLLDRARAAIERLEAKWSRFRPTSELSQLNRAAGREWLVESHFGEWRLIHNTARIRLATYAQARENAVRYLQTWNVPTRVRNAYTGDTEDVCIEAIIHVHPKGRPNGPNVAKFLPRSTRRPMV